MLGCAVADDDEDQSKAACIGRPRFVQAFAALQQAVDCPRQPPMPRFRARPSCRFSGGHVHV